MEGYQARLLYQGDSNNYHIGIKKGRSLIHIDCSCNDFRRGKNFCKHLTAIITGDFSKVIDEENGELFRQILAQINPEDASLMADEVATLQARREQLEQELKQVKAQIKEQKERIEAGWYRGDRDAFSLNIKG